MNSGVEKTVSPTKLAGTGFAPHDADVDSDFGKATLRKVSRRLMPFLVTAFILNFIDRVKIGFAALQMNADLGFSATVFGYGAGILFVSYFAFGVPSNLMLHRVGARRWISSLLAVWGLIAAGMAFIQGEKSFYVMRFLLGATEAGFYPGVLVFLSCWFLLFRCLRVLPPSCFHGLPPFRMLCCVWCCRVLLYS